MACYPWPRDKEARKRNWKIYDHFRKMYMASYRKEIKYFEEQIPPKFEYEKWVDACVELQYSYEKLMSEDLDRIIAGNHPDQKDYQDLLKKANASKFLLALA